MSTIKPQGEQLKKAVEYISEMRKKDPDVDLTRLVDDAALKYDLSPKDSEFLIRFVNENN